MAAVTIAVLDESIPQQLDTNPQPDLEVVWRGTQLGQLRSSAGRIRPQVLVLDLELLGASPVQEIDALQRDLHAELVITLYKFARRQVVSELAGDGRRAVKAPISVEGLRAQMMSVLIRSIFDGEAARDGAGEKPFVAQPTRFSASQLGKLAELKSTIECECPNHVSTIVAELQAFELYAARCENRNAADAAVHRALYEQTSRARSLMEAALERLIEHEKIAL